MNVTFRETFESLMRYVLILLKHNKWFQCSYC